MKSNRTMVTLLLLSLLFQLVPAAALPVAAQATPLPDKSQVSAVLYKVNQYWMDGHTDPGNTRWNRAVYFAGDMAYYQMSSNVQTLQYADTWANQNEWALFQPCKYENGWQFVSVDADDQAVGQTYLELYKQEPYDWKISCLKESINRSMVWAQFEVDLGATKTLNQVKLYPYNNRAYRYYVDVATTTGGPYTQVVNRHANAEQAAVLTDTFTPTAARYVRVLVIGAKGYGGKMSENVNDNENWVSIGELELFGIGSPTTNLALNRTITCSSEPQPANGCKNLVDGNRNNRWAASFPPPEYVTHKRDSMNWWWIDAIYMSMPTYAQFYLLENNPRYAEVMNVRYHYARDEAGRDTMRGLLDRNYGLWYRDPRYIQPSLIPLLREPIFWSRGNGWVFAALARTLQILPPTAPYYSEYLADFKAMAAKIIAAQQPEGYWTTNLLQRAENPGGESSGTSLFAYGLAWGINNGHLVGDGYRNAVNKAWNWLATTAVRADGFLQYVQSEGSQPGGAAVDSTTDFGVGVFLLAGSEVYKLAANPILSPHVTVNSTADPGNGLCDSNECTLREAVALVAPGGTINFSIPLSATIRLTANQLVLNKPLTLQGPGIDQLTIRGGREYKYNFRVLQTSANGIVVQGLTLSDGMSKEAGSGIYNSGELTLRDVAVTGNWSIPPLAMGGGIYNANGAKLTLDHVLIRGNRSNESGAGLANGGVVIIRNSEISQNESGSSGGLGGGILNLSPGKIYIQIDANGNWLPGATNIAKNEATSAGAIQNMGEIRMVHTTINNNFSSTGIGGIWNYGTLSMVESSFVNNGAGEGIVAGIWNQGSFEMVRSLLANNYTPDTIGGFYNVGNASFINSTISNNHAREEAGIANNGVLTMTNSTVSNNVISDPYRPIGSGLSNHATATLVNTIVSGNTNYNCSGTITSLGGNLSSDNSCSFNRADDLNATNPKLNALAENGGATQTYALAVDSPAVDSANDSQCPTTDQRGLPRPKDGNGDGNARCDRGAFELQGVPSQATITIGVDTVPDDILNFRFYGPFGTFLLDDAYPNTDDTVLNSISYTVTPGSYNFTWNKPFGWFLNEVRCDRPELATVNLAQFSVKLNVKGGDTVNCTFVNQASASVTVFSYWDKNGNRTFDSGDVGQAGWWSTLYDSTGKLKASNATDASGNWKVVNLRPGTYTVCQNPRSGWYNSWPTALDPKFGNRTCYTVTLSPAYTFQLHFGYSDHPLVASATDETAMTAGTVPVASNPGERQEGFYTAEEFLATYGGELPFEEENSVNLYLPLINR
ncbi:MAG: glycoside hydrolase family 88 protein [Caldilineaceae bacterium]